MADTRFNDESFRRHPFEKENKVALPTGTGKIHKPSSTQQEWVPSDQCIETQYPETSYTGATAPPEFTGTCNDSFPRNDIDYYPIGSSGATGCTGPAGPAGP